MPARQSGAGRGLVVASPGSWPAISWSSSAASRTVRVIGPTWSFDHDRAIAPARLTRPYVGLSPTMPQQAAGRRMDPPVSVPSAPTARPAATAAPEPLLDPPET